MADESDDGEIMSSLRPATLTTVSGQSICNNIDSHPLAGDPRVAVVVVGGDIGTETDIDTGTGNEVVTGVVGLNRPIRDDEDGEEDMKDDK